MEKPKVSIIMSVYNGEEFLRESILSILNQTYRDFEFIIVNDKSTDSTAKILEDFKNQDSRIKVIENSENLGLTKSLNKGIAASSGEYIARLDAGDLSIPERLERQVMFLNQNKRVGLVGTWMEIFDANNGTFRYEKYPTENEDIKKDLINYNPFVHSSIMFKRVVGARVGFYDESYKYAQDYNFYFKLFPYTEFANIGAFLTKYRRMPNSITSTKNKEQVRSANSSRIYAIRQGFYSKWNYVYVLKNFLISLIPTKIKFLIKEIL